MGRVQATGNQRPMRPHLYRDLYPVQHPGSSCFYERAVFKVDRAQDDCVYIMTLGAQMQTVLPRCHPLNVWLKIGNYAGWFRCESCGIDKTLFSPVNLSLKESAHNDEGIVGVEGDISLLAEKQRNTLLHPVSFYITLFFSFTFNWKVTIIKTPRGKKVEIQWLGVKRKSEKIDRFINMLY